jgi:hypothetical protein
MTPVEQLKRADTLDQAEQLFYEYDVVPYPRAGAINGFFKRKDSKIKPIETGLLLSEGTSVFQLLELLNQNKFYFVISGNRIVGYIHYSDFNRSITKIPFFGLLQTVEKKLWGKIQDRISEEDLLKIFADSEFKTFVRKRNRNRRRNVDIGWTGVFAFPSVLRLARFYGQIDLLDNEIKLLKETRNKVAHSDRVILSSYNDVRNVTRAYEICQSLIARI